MKKLKSITALLLVSATLLVCTSMAVAKVRFTDVAETDWFYTAVEYCADNKVMNGTAENMFSPNENMSRAMFVTVLYRIEGSPEIVYDGAFLDVAQNAWYADAVAWGTQSGIVSGYSSGLFGADDPVTREQITTMLWRYAGNPDADNGLLRFNDEDEISDYAVTAVHWAQSVGIVSGKPENRFDPKGCATRAEAAVMLYNYLKLQPIAAEESEPETEPEPKASPEPETSIGTSTPSGGDTPHVQIPSPESSPEPTPTDEPETETGSDATTVRIVVGEAVFSVTLYDNAAAEALLARLPMTISMSELNGNEKYYYLNETLPTASEQVGSIHAGDLMLYGNNCLVLFYESFNTSYNYTRLGYIDNPAGLASALGRGSVEATFSND